MIFHKALLFSLQTLCKREKICYNKAMANRKEKNSEGFLSSLIGERTAAKTAGLTYTVAALAMFGVSFLFLFLPRAEGETPQWLLYLNFLAAPIAFSLTGVWYFSHTKNSVKAFAKEQLCHPKYYLIALMLAVGLFSLTELNGLFLKFLSLFGYESGELLLPDMKGIGFLGVLLTVAVLPALMEEFVFRGIFLRETKDFSLWTRAIVCGALFALYHQNPAQTAYQFVCGTAFSIVAIKSGSMLPTALAHFINNAVILCLYKLGITVFPPPVYAIILCVSGICLVGAFVYLLVFDRKQEEEKEGRLRQLFACASIGIIMLALSWLATLSMGF